MNDLEMCVAIAKLEGVDVSKDSHFKCLYLPCGIDSYNPITDLSLNCALRDKYKVTVEYAERSSFCGIGIGCEAVFVDFSHQKHIPRAVIECILKANGLYK